MPREERPISSRLSAIDFQYDVHPASGTDPSRGTQPEKRQGIRETIPPASSTLRTHRSACTRSSIRAMVWNGLSSGSFRSARSLFWGASKQGFGALVEVVQAAGPRGQGGAPGALGEDERP